MSTVSAFIKKCQLFKMSKLKSWNVPGNSFRMSKNPDMGENWKSENVGFWPSLLSAYQHLPTTTNTHKNSEDQSDEQGFHGKASKSRPLTNSLSMRSSQRTYSISLSTSVNTRTNISWGDGGGERGSLCVCGWVVSQIVMLLFLKSIWRIAAPTWTSWP